MWRLLNTMPANNKWSFILAREKGFSLAKITKSSVELAGHRPYPQVSLQGNILWSSHTRWRKELEIWMRIIISSLRTFLKRFPGCVALDDVSFSIKRAKYIHCLAKMEQGNPHCSIFYMEFTNPQMALFPLMEKKLVFIPLMRQFCLALPKVHQEINVIPDMTVAQNIMLGCEPQKAFYRL